MIKTSIEVKDTKHFKLTVAVDRVSIKVPITATEEDKEKIIPFLQSVADQCFGKSYRKFTPKEKIFLKTEAEGGIMTVRGNYNPVHKRIAMKFGDAKQLFEVYEHL